MDKITRSGKNLIFEKHVHPVFRLIVFLISFFPLLAPYDLLLKIRWENYFNLPFLISLLFSIAATAFSLFILFISLGDFDTKEVAQQHQTTLTKTISSPESKCYNSHGRIS